MVVGHGGLTSDSGGNGGALRRRRRTATTSTLRLRGEVDDLERKKMESWASWKRCFHGGERARRRHGLAAMAQRRCFSRWLQHARDKEIERARASGKAGGRGLQAFASGQWRQASHGAWRPRGGWCLSPVGTVLSSIF